MQVGAGARPKECTTALRLIVDFFALRRLAAVFAGVVMVALFVSLPPTVTYPAIHIWPVTVWQCAVMAVNWQWFGSWQRFMFSPLSIGQQRTFSKVQAVTVHSFCELRSARLLPSPFWQ